MKNKIVCQGETLNLDCRSGHHIAIDNAIFGRVHGNAICPKDPLWVKNVNCVARSSVEVKFVLLFLPLFFYQLTISNTIFVI